MWMGSNVLNRYAPTIVKLRSVVGSSPGVASDCLSPELFTIEKKVSKENVNFKE
jgi:hypothetical protein